MKQPTAHFGKQHSVFHVKTSRGLHVDGRILAKPMPTAHAHDDIELFLIVSGGANFLFNGRNLRPAAGKVCLFWSGIPHQSLHIQPQTFCWFVNLPLAWVLQWSLPQALVHRLLSGEMVADDASEETVVEAAAFRRWQQLAAKGREETLRIILLEIQARIRRLALSFSVASNAVPDAQDLTQSTAFTQFETMMRLLVENAGDPELSIRQVAAAVGLQPNYACTLFRRFSGRRPVEFLTQQRLSHAQYLLAASDRKILDIAADSGFGSPARFYVTFAKHCNESPRAYRLRMQAVKAAPNMA